MAGPLDILKSIAGTHSAAGRAGAGASGAPFPAVDAETLRSYREVSNTLSDIQTKMRNLSRAGSTMGMGRYAQEARKLAPLQRAIEEVADAEREYHTLLRDQNSTIRQQVEAYDRLSEAKQRQIRLSNETQGVFGRIKNVADDLKANKWAVMWAAAIRDLTIIANDMNRGFDTMAKSGQTLDKSFTELALSSGKFALNMKLAAIQGAMFGHSVDDSQMAFQKLVEALGGTNEAVEEISDNFTDLAKIAKFSGISIGEAAEYAENRMRRLGGGAKEANEDLANIGLSVRDLVGLFGAGSVNAGDYLKAINELSFASTRYNQNTKLLNETLGHELAVQLSLGKSREAAMSDAKRNLAAAGKPSFYGMQQFAQRLQADFQQNGMTREAAMERFGSEGELILRRLQEGSLSSSQGVLFLQKAAENSDEVRNAVMDMVRSSAARGQWNMAALLEGSSPQDIQYMIDTEKQRSKEFDALRTAARGTGPNRQAEITEALSNIFSKESGIKLDDSSIQQFVKAISAEGSGKESDREAFRKVVTAQLKGGGADAPESPLDEFFRRTEEGDTWFSRILNTLKMSAGLLGTMPVALAGALALMHGPGMVGKLGGMLGSARGGIGGLLQRGSTLPGLMNNAGSAVGGVGRFGGAAGMARGAGVAAAGAAILYSAYSYYNAYKNAGDILGKAEDKVTTLDRTTVAAASAINGILLGLPEMIFGPDTVKNIAMNLTKPADALFDILHRDTPDSTPGVVTAIERLDDQKAMYQAYLKRNAGNENALDFASWQAMIGRKSMERADAAATVQHSGAMNRQAASRPSQGKEVSPTLPRDGAAAAAGSGGAASAVASISGRNLILEVSNWDSVLAASLYAQESVR